MTYLLMRGSFSTIWWPIRNDADWPCGDSWREAPANAEIVATAERTAALDAAFSKRSGFDGKSLLVFLMAIVSAWPNAAPALASPAELRKQRATVVDAIRRLFDG